MGAEKKTQLNLMRKDLLGLPDVRLPPGYALRHYQAGDEAVWERILTESFNRKTGSMPFDTIMKSDPAFRAERILFVTHADEPVATASAYTRAHVLPDAGMLHYVAVLPAHRGLRLGYLASLAALHHMRAEALGAAWTVTDDFRLAAIKIYLALGFEPWMAHPDHPARWQAVLAALGSLQNPASAASRQTNHRENPVPERRKTPEYCSRKTQVMVRMQPALMTMRARSVLYVFGGGLALRFAFASLLPLDALSADTQSWITIANLLEKGWNPYRATSLLNWPPFWMQGIFVMGQLSAFTGVPFEAVLHLVLVGFETLLALLLYRMLSSRLGHRQALTLVGVGICFNPACILLTIQHGNFDVFVALWVLLFIQALLRYHTDANGRDETWLAAAFFLGLGILTKTVPFMLLPLLCYRTGPSASA